MNKRWMGLLALSVVAACSSAQPGAPTTVTRATTPVGCPLGVAGAKATVEDAPDGLVINLTTKGDPTELRKRAFDASAQYGPGSNFGAGHDGKHRGAGHHGLRLHELPRVNVGFVEKDGGGYLHLAAVDPADVETLRLELRARVAELNSVTCTE